MMRVRIALFAIPFFVAACGTRPIVPTGGHIQQETERGGTIPPPVNQVILPPPPKPHPKAERYTVVVNNVKVQQLLFALARDAKVNVDIHPGIEGNVTLNAIDQTLPQILSRISRQVDMRYEIDGNSLIVVPDTPFLRNYKVDYVNMARDASSEVAVSTQISTTGTAAVGATASTGGGNNSTTTINNTSRNRFWDTLVQNVKDVLRETDKVLPPGSSETQTEQSSRQTTTGTGEQQASSRRRTPARSATTTIAGSPNAAEFQEAEVTTTRRITYREAASVIANPETGIISVRANSRQHEKVQEFLDAVVGSARKQVLIEATVVEVQLNDRYQAGVDWSRIANGGSGITFQQSLLGGNLASPPTFILNYANPSARIGGNISATVRLLDSFGTTRVLSSPKLMVLNNQTALLKVVENRVFFTVKAETTTNQTTAITTFTTTANSVPVGFVMSVTPQISDANGVLLNVRPTISRITGFVTDPNPQLAAAGVVSRVPEIQTREMESVMQVSSGQVAVLGGLMQDSSQKNRDGLPVLSRVPAVGDAFSFRDDEVRKTELVIFMRPIVTRESGGDADLASYRTMLPDREFFRSESPKAPPVSPKSRKGTEAAKP
jgi:MSHA biogenesis protein MshL